MPRGGVLCVGVTEHLLLLSRIFNKEKDAAKPVKCRVIVMYKGRYFSGERFKGSLVGVVLLKPFDCNPV